MPGQPPVAYVIQPAAQDPTEMYALKNKVDTWSTVVKVVGGILLVFGGLKTICSVMGFLFVGAEGGVKIRGEDCDESFELPLSTVLFEKVLNGFVGLLLLYQGSLAWKASKSKTR